MTADHSVTLETFDKWWAKTSFSQNVDKGSVLLGWIAGNASRQTEIERLSAALREIANLAEPFRPNTRSRAVYLARAALESTQ